jgi:membrane protease YdiL (CAAX protease family)
VRRSRSSPPQGAILLAAWLVLYGNAIAWPPLPAWVVFAANLLVGFLAVTAARRRDYSLAELGLSAAGWQRGWKLGLGLGVIVVAAIAILTGPLYQLEPDPAVRGMPLVVLAWQVLIRIPVGTALFEETMFRGLLYASWHRVAGWPWAALWSSVAFAFWHVVVELHRQERLGHRWGGDAFTAAIPTLLFLFAVGLLFCLLRRRTHGVVAPAIVHWSANAAAAVATYIVTNGGGGG